MTNRNTLDARLTAILEDCRARAAAEVGRKKARFEAVFLGHVNEALKDVDFGVDRGKMLAVASRAAAIVAEFNRSTIDSRLADALDDCADRAAVEVGADRGRFEPVLYGLVNERLREPELDLGGDYGKFFALAVGAASTAREFRAAA